MNWTRSAVANDPAPPRPRRPRRRVLSPAVPMCSYEFAQPMRSKGKKQFKLQELTQAPPSNPGALDLLQSQPSQATTPRHESPSRALQLRQRASSPRETQPGALQICPRSPNEVKFPLTLTYPITTSTVSYPLLPIKARIRMMFGELRHRRYRLITVPAKVRKAIRQAPLTQGLLSVLYSPQNEVDGTRCTCCRRDFAAVLGAFTTCKEKLDADMAAAVEGGVPVEQAHEERDAKLAKTEEEGGHNVWVYVFPCRHVFCSTCAKCLLERFDLCPQCLQSVVTLLARGPQTGYETHYPAVREYYEATHHAAREAHNAERRATEDTVSGADESEDDDDAPPRWWADAASPRPPTRRTGRTAAQRYVDRLAFLEKIDLEHYTEKAAQAGAAGSPTARGQQGSPRQPNTNTAPPSSTQRRLSDDAQWRQPRERRPSAATATAASSPSAAVSQSVTRAATAGGRAAPTATTATAAGSRFRAARANGAGANSSPAVGREEVMVIGRMADGYRPGEANEYRPMPLRERQSRLDNPASPAEEEEEEIPERERLLIDRLYRAAALVEHSVPGEVVDPQNAEFDWSPHGENGGQGWYTYF